MKKDDEFYVSYIDGSLGAKTKQTLKLFILLTTLLIAISALLFSFSQKPFNNATFDLFNETKITGTFYENPYPMLRVKIAKNTYKNILLLGFGKSSANPFLENLRLEVDDLNGKQLSIVGNLIYYNGKTLIQITDAEKVTLQGSVNKIIPQKEAEIDTILQGEIIDPKCYFGVMKPGKGKIHKSCAIRCISGGIPPVLVTTDKNNSSQYFLLTDSIGQPIHKEILQFVGKPSQIRGVVAKQEDWFLLKINPSDIKILSEESTIY